MNPKPQQVS